MQRSDPPRPAGADPAAANSDPHEPAAESPSPEPADDALAEADTEATDRTHFEALERETTEPVRRYFEPRSVTDITPADLGHAVDYAVPVEGVAMPSSDAELPQTDPAPPEPWPDPLPATSESEGEQHAAEPMFGELPVPADEEERAPESVADPAALEPSPASEAEVAPPAHGEPEPPSQQPAHAFEPSPFAVPPPRAASPPSFEPSHIEPAHFEPWPQPETDAPAYYEPQTPEPVAPSPDAERHAPVADAQGRDNPDREGREPEPQREPQPEHSPEPLPVTLQHDVAAAWSRTPTPRHEPTFARAEPSWQPDAMSGASPLGATERDYRDLFRRGVRVAALVFCGWLIGVMLLIVAYRFINPPFSMLMAQQFLTGTAIHKQWMPIERISPNLTRAVIVAEDGRFCEHWGVDLIEAANAIRRASDGYPRGASTITMQVAKNLFLVNTKSYLRKMVEIPLTFAIELAWPKWRILEVYLNVVEWGPGIFGAEAASRSHFGRSAAGLTARQAAQLAVSLPNPIVRDAGSPGPRTAHRASVIQARAARTRQASACVDGAR
jgi:monofunctional biosynthetic peptidoglycan transglycosylase